MIGKEASQEWQMGLSPVSDPFVVVAIGNRAADDQQQYLWQWMRDAPRLPRVFDQRKMVEKRPKT